MENENDITELRLQQQMFVHIWNKYPDKRGLLFMLHNTPQNSIKGSQLVGAGMVRGIADFLLLKNYGKYIFIEIKLPNETQSIFQKWFEKICNLIRGDYVVCDNIIEMEKIFLANVADGIMPVMPVKGKG